MLVLMAAELLQEVCGDLSMAVITGLISTLHRWLIPIQSADWISELYAILRYWLELQLQLFRAGEYMITHGHLTRVRVIFHGLCSHRVLQLLLIQLKL